MELMAMVMYRGSLAYYRIGLERDGIYFANLEEFNGNIHSIPPTNLTLTRGLKHWSGSTDEQSLVDDLGEIIDNYIEQEKERKEKEWNE